MHTAPLVATVLSEPELGPELNTAARFPTWSGDNPVGYTVLNEDANNFVTEHANGARIVSNNTTVLSMGRSITGAAVAGKTYRIQVTKSDHVAGLIRYATSGGLPGATANMAGSDTNGSFFIDVTATSTGDIVFTIFRLNGANTDYVINEISIRQKF